MSNYKCLSTWEEVSLRSYEVPHSHNLESSAVQVMFRYPVGTYELYNWPNMLFVSQSVPISSSSEENYKLGLAEMSHSGQYHGG